MTYIYDILLNFQDNYYDFFEWNNDDKITHIKRMPLIKISNQDFNLIKNSLVTFDDEFLKNIHNKTQIFKKYDINTLPYICTLCTENETMGIKINKNGKLIGKSSLLIDESDEALELASNLGIYQIKYTAKQTNNILNWQTRKETNDSKKILKDINLLYETKEFNKLNYMFFECFGYKEKNIINVLNKIKEEIYNFTDNYYIIKNILKLINQK